MKEISCFRYRNSFEKKISRKIRPTLARGPRFWLQTKNPGENFLNLWLLGCVSSLLLYLKFREAGNEAGRCPEGWGAENIISVNYDETNSGAEGATAGEKWATNGGHTNFEESCKW